MSEIKPADLFDHLSKQLADIRDDNGSDVDSSFMMLENQERSGLIVYAEGICVEDIKLALNILIAMKQVEYDTQEAMSEVLDNERLSEEVAGNTQH